MTIGVTQATGVSATSVTATLTALINELPITPYMFGAKGDGVTNDSVAIQAAIDVVFSAGGGVVKLQHPVYRAANLILKSGVILEGAFKDATIIKAPDGWTGISVIETYNFDYYKNNVTDAACPNACGLSNIVIDANAENYAGTPSVTAGYGVRLAALRLMIDNVRIQAAPGTGLHTSLGGITRLTADWYRHDLANGYIRNLSVFGSRNDGWVHDGPGDLYVESCDLGVNGYPDNVGFSGSYPSFLEPSRRVANFVANTAVEIGWMHSFGCTQGYGFIMGKSTGGFGNKRVKWGILIVESCNAGIWARDGLYYQGGILDMHNCYGVDGSAYFRDERTTLAAHIDNVQIDLTGANHGQDVVQLMGNYTSIGNLAIYGNGYGCRGVVIGGSQSKVHKLAVDNLRDIANLGTKSSVHILATATNWTVNAQIRNSDILATMDAGAGTPVDSSIVGAFGNGTVDFVGFSVLTATQRKEISLHNLSGDKRSRGYVGVSANIVADSTTLKTISVPINALFNPLQEEIQISLVYSSGGQPDITTFMFDGNNMSTSSITIYVKFAAISAAVVRAVVSVR